MAQRITIVDDVDQESEAVGIVEFGFRITGPAGRTQRLEYVLDLNAGNLEELTETLLEWAKFGRKPDKAPLWLRPGPAPAPPHTATEDALPPKPVAEVVIADPPPGDAPPTFPEWQTPPDAPDRERPEWTAMRQDARDWSGVNGFPRTAVRGKIPPAAYLAWKQAMGWTGPIFEEWKAWRDSGASADKSSNPGRGKQSTLM